MMNVTLSLLKDRFFSSWQRSASQDPLRCAMVEFFKHRPFEPSFPQPATKGLTEPQEHADVEQACSSWQGVTYFINMCLWSNSILCPLCVRSHVAFLDADLAPRRQMPLPGAVQAIMSIGFLGFVMAF